MIVHKQQFYFLCLFLLFIISCQNQGQRVPKELNLSPKAFEFNIAQTKDAIVLDVRTPEEVNQGTLPNAMVINFYDKDFQEQVATLDKNKTYFVYCKSGGRSAKACNELKKAGISKVYNLDGGITAWKKTNLPLDQHK